MPEIYLNCEYTLIKTPQNFTEETYKFTESSEDMIIDVEISYATATVIAKISRAVISDEQVAELQKYGQFDGDKISSFCREAITSILQIASRYTVRILSLIKYHLDHYELAEQPFSIKSQKWGLTPYEMLHIPLQTSIAVSTNYVTPLNEENYEKIQASLIARIEPLLAMRYLHRARHENRPHYKWIDATIAAELAIKEVLSRSKPEIEILLLELPSPPISKLYGTIMEKYLGQQSPYRKALIKGAEVRNALIHRHDDKSVNSQDAIDYVREVERAIFHLLTLLYPEDALIKSAYARKLRASFKLAPPR